MAAEKKPCCKKPSAGNNGSNTISITAGGRELSKCRKGLRHDGGCAENPRGNRVPSEFDLYLRGEVALRDTSATGSSQSAAGAAGRGNGPAARPRTTAVKPGERFYPEGLRSEMTGLIQEHVGLKESDSTSWASFKQRPDVDAAIERAVEAAKDTVDRTHIETTWHFAVSRALATARKKERRAHSSESVDLTGIGVDVCYRTLDRICGEPNPGRLYAAVLEEESHRFEKEAAESTGPKPKRPRGARQLWASGRNMRVADMNLGFAALSAEEQQRWAAAAVTDRERAKTETARWNRDYATKLSSLKVTPVQPSVPDAPEAVPRAIGTARPEAFEIPTADAREVSMPPNRHIQRSPLHPQQPRVNLTPSHTAVSGACQSEMTLLDPTNGLSATNGLNVAVCRDDRLLSVESGDDSIHGPDSQWDPSNLSSVFSWDDAEVAALTENPRDSLACAFSRAFCSSRRAQSLRVYRLGSGQVPQALILIGLVGQRGQLAKGEVKRLVRVRRGVEPLLRPGAHPLQDVRRPRPVLHVPLQQGTLLLLRAGACHHRALGSLPFPPTGGLRHCVVLVVPRAATLRATFCLSVVSCPSARCRPSAPLCVMSRHTKQTVQCEKPHIRGGAQ